MKILLQAIKSLLRKVENTAERVLNFFGKDEIIKQEHLPDGYPYGEIVEILPETTIEIGTLLPKIGIISTPFTLVPGNEYTVVWNGTEYVCIAQEHTNDGVASIAIGNIGGNAVEPFGMAYITADLGLSDELVGKWLVVAHDGSTSATISIHSGTATKMDVKYLPDGYPYVETAEILPRTTIDINPDDGGAVIQTPFTLVPGNEYTVTFNGEDYTCIAQMVETEPGTFLVAIGNVGAIMEGSDTGEPFVVAYLALEVGSLLHQIMVLDGSTSVTISIVGDRIVKMDARYLPDEVALKSDLEGLGGSGGSPATATALPASGTALTANTIYNVSAAVGTYAFTPPATGWAHGKFTTGASASVSFAGTFLGAAPAIEASKTYEFDVLDGVWAVQEVVSA